MTLAGICPWLGFTRLAAFSYYKNTPLDLPVQFSSQEKFDFLTIKKQGSIVLSLI